MMPTKLIFMKNYNVDTSLKNACLLGQKITSVTSRPLLSVTSRTSFCKLLIFKHRFKLYCLSIVIFLSKNAKEVDLLDIDVCRFCQLKYGTILWTMSSGTSESQRVNLLVDILMRIDYIKIV